MTKLSVNLNKIALIRNARGGGQPDLVEAARTVIGAGAYGFTVHPRPDERHARYSDVYELSDLSRELSVEFNVEGNPFFGRYMEVVKDVRPDQATLVPDSPDAITSDNGWDIEAEAKRLRPVVSELAGAGIRVSLFVNPGAGGFELAREMGVGRVELYTESYAKAYETGENLDDVLTLFADTARRAQAAGLGVNAGHDLNLDNLEKFITAVPGVLEVSIGQALIVDALEQGLAQAVKEYVKILNRN